MPTPDGRSWLTSSSIGLRLADALVTDKMIPEAQRDRVAAALTKAYQLTGYDIEFKILRLTEQLKRRLDLGDRTVFNPDCGACNQTRQAFRDIYNLEVLDQFDEEGNLVGG